VSARARRGSTIIAADTSVLVAAFASWHEHHAAAADALAAGVRLPGHCALETMSVLTRLPAPYRASGKLVHAFLAANFPSAPLVLTAGQHAALLEELPRRGIAGGAVYDALVAATARAAGAEIVTLDVRARRTYAELDVAHRSLA
jgi:predicted nucleic acid-binding protein